MRDKTSTGQKHASPGSAKKLVLLQIALFFALVLELVAITAPRTLRTLEVVLAITVLFTPLTIRLLRKCRAYAENHFETFHPAANNIIRMATLPPKAFFTLVLFLLPASVILPINRLLDNADATVQQVEIIDKRYASSTDDAGNTTERYRVLYQAPVKSIIPFGPENYRQSMRVDEKEHPFFRPNASTIELEIHPGFLGLPWVRRTSKRLQMGALPDAALIAAACRYTAHFNPDNNILAMEPTGYNRDYWPNGKIKSEEPLVYGKPHGIAHYKFDKGQTYGDIPWKNGKKHGVFTLFREDGSKEMRLSYRNGNLYGVNEWYTVAGNLSQRALYLGDDNKPLDASVCNHYK